MMRHGICYLKMNVKKIGLVRMNVLLEKERNLRLGLVHRLHGPPWWHIHTITSYKKKQDMIAEVSG